MERTKPSLKILATAVVNQKYRWKKNYSNITIRTVLKNNCIVFQEVSTKTIDLQLQTVKDLFDQNKSAEDIVFLKSENIEFYYYIRKKEKNESLH